VEVLLAGLLLWSLGTGLTAGAGAGGAHALLLLVLSRVAVGLFSACIMPSVSAMSAREVPREHRAFSVSLIYALFNIGAWPGTPAVRG
jgi:MFS family permease